MVMVMLMVLSSCYSCRFQSMGYCGLFDDLVNGTKCIFYRDMDGEEE